MRQAEQALRIYFVNFLQRTDWLRRSASTVVDEHGRAEPVGERRRFLWCRREHELQAFVLPTATNPRGSWLTPTSVLQPRFFKISAQIDF